MPKEGATISRLIPRPHAASLETRNPNASTTTTHQSISTVDLSLEASDTRSYYQQTNFYSLCLPRSLPALPRPRRLLPSPPLMAPTLVRLSPRNAVVLRSRKLQRVRRPILTHSDRYGKGRYHQGESTFSGALLPPHLCLRRLPAHLGWKQIAACQCSVTSWEHSLTCSLHTSAQGTQWVKVS